ncbi:MAG: hypothetical protein H5T81_12580, partial [Tetrasphaera sp.]|nr:hypothetical protein [Tetrasphaera sp.]
SGVYIDEEMVRLQEAQRAFQAAARAITVMDDALNTIINGMGISQAVASGGNGARRPHTEPPGAGRTSGSSPPPTARVGSSRRSGVRRSAPASSSCSRRRGSARRSAARRRWSR